MNISVIGLGLIGGSIAKDLHSQINVNVYGVDENNLHANKALELNLVQKIISLVEALEKSEIIILATPVNIIEKMLPHALDKIDKHQTIIDVGSTKSAICDAVRNHKNRNRFVAAHPLAGTEFSGPEAALKGLFQYKKNIICEKELTDDGALEAALKLFSSLGMESYFLSPEEHDKHLAYVSHLSHVSSFMLGLTVLNIEKDEKQIFNLASTGFESTVRLAKSNPNTWAPIFGKNKKYISEALDNYIELLHDFKNKLDNEDDEGLMKAMRDANEIKRILK
jgi:prephenate dehydrogenase